MIPEEPEAYYKAEDGISIFPCTRLQAHLWLLGGYLASDTPFSLRRADGQDGEWTTLGELMARNGRSMPFTEWCSSEKERKEQEEDLDRLTREMDELGKRRAELSRSLREAQDRLGTVNSELRRLVDKYPPEVARIVQTHTKLLTNTMMQGGSGSETDATRSQSPVVHSQLTPPPNVDPFALLKSCIHAKRKLDGDVVNKFKQLRVRFDRCDKKRLVQQTYDLINPLKPRMCLLCRLKLDSTNNILEHICGSKHVFALASVVCADAFDFWSSAVETATDPSNRRAAPHQGYGRKETTAMKITVAGFGATKPAPSSKPEPANGEPLRRSVQGSTAFQPRADILGLDILRKAQKVYDPCANPREELAAMQRMFKFCDKKKLDNDSQTMGFFVKPLLCMICNRCAIDKASNLVTHITGNGHIEMITSENCLVSQNAIDFWMKAVQQASISFTINN